MSSEDWQFWCRGDMLRQTIANIREATGNARSLTVERCMRRIISDDDAATDRRWWASELNTRNRPGSLGLIPDKTLVPGSIWKSTKDEQHSTQPDILSAHIFLPSSFCLFIYIIHFWVLPPPFISASLSAKWSHRRPPAGSILLGLSFTTCNILRSFSHLTNHTCVDLQHHACRDANLWNQQEGSDGCLGPQQDPGAAPQWGACY